MFDTKLINSNKIRYSDNVKNSDFYQFIYSDLKERLEPIDKSYQEILVLDFCDYHLVQFDKFHRLNYANPFQIESIENGSIDLVFFPFGLHWLGDVQKFLAKIRTILKENGVFICNFLGAGSLSFLRKALFISEESANVVHFPHISPFIKFDDMTPLLQQAGFAENIIDYETINLEYASPILFMKALKNLGESNVIYGRTHYSITKPMYKYLERSYSNTTFSDQLNLITFISSPKKNSIKLKMQYFQKNS